MGREAMEQTHRDEHCPRVLALDVGDRRIGLAVSDALGVSGFPLPPMRNNSSQWKELKRIIDQYHVQYVVVGMPYQLDGEIGPQGEKVRAWIELLKKRFDLPVHTVDERMTTRLAEQALIAGEVRREKRKNVIDSLAALLILQTYLERNKRKAVKKMAELHDDENNIVLLTDEEGVEHEFELIDVIAVGESDYAILAVLDNDEDAIVLRIEEDENGKRILVDIEDEEEWEEVARAWEEIQDEEWDEDGWDDDDEDDD